MKSHTIHSTIEWRWTTMPATLLVEQLATQYSPTLADALAEGTDFCTRYEHDRLGYGIEQLLQYTGTANGDMHAVLENIALGLMALEASSPDALAGLAAALLSKRHADIRSRAHVEHIAGAILAMAAARCLDNARCEREYLWSVNSDVAETTGFASLGPYYLPVGAAAAMERLYAAAMAEASGVISSELKFVGRADPRPPDDPTAAAT